MERLKNSVTVVPCFYSQIEIKHPIFSGYQKPYSYSKIDYILQDGKKEVYTYNDQGEVATIIFYDENGEVSNSYRYEYVYDAQGNWVKKKQTFQTPIPDKYPEIVRREITYYD